MSAQARGDQATGAAGLWLAPCGPDDRAARNAIFFRAVREGAAEHYSAAERAAWAPGLPDTRPTDRLADQWCLVARRGAEAVGFMSMTPDGHLDMAFVLPEERGRGAAATLYAALLERAQQAGLRRLTAHASHLARPFLARRGWRIDHAERVALRGEMLERFAMSIDLQGGGDGTAT